MYDINNYCIKCGQPLRNGKCAYGCDGFGNYKKYNNNQRKKQTRKIKMKTISKLEKKCYYCNETKNLEVDYLPSGKYTYLCSFHLSWNYFSKQNKKLSSKDFSKHCIPGLVALIKKRKEKRRAS